jgi:cytochrome oxidase Cu insertion factor (SCO1/SenC/PrrC family)
MTRRDAWPLGAIGFVLMVSAAWWWVALGSIPGAPEWLERARSVCFNITETGLPDRKGWLLLFGQPPTMLAMLAVGWGGDVRDSLARLASRPAGRASMAGVVLMALTGLSLAAVRVADARLPEVTFGSDEPAPETYPRLDMPWPASEGLVSQAGVFDLKALGGEPAFVTFAFGHCVTICPVVVHQAREVRRLLQRDVAIVVVTLDPWRDTPSRLEHLVDQFELDSDRDFVVSGTIDDVNTALDRWKLPRDRDEMTGDITHPGIVYMVEGDGTLAYASTGGVAQMESLGRRLR